MKSALRLRRSADFERARRCGKVLRHRALLISFCANPLPHNRYGIVAGRRHGIAALRNRLKRRLRAALMDLHPGLRQGFDIVVVARGGAQAQPFGELRRMLSELFLRARLIETC